MKKIILMGRSECGKTTLTQALKGDVIHYHKTQYINHYDVVIDTPGEYAENASLAKALALYAKISPPLFAILHKFAHLPHCFYLLFGYLLTELWGLKDSLQTVKL